jgi:hypothetical protein
MYCFQYVIPSEMAVPNQFVDVSTESNVPDLSPASTTSSDILMNLDCSCGFPFAEVVSLTSICLLAMLCLVVHVARMSYYVLNGVGAGVFILDR